MQPSTSFHDREDTSEDACMGRALSSLAEECEAYAASFYWKAKGWRFLHYILVCAITIGPTVIGIVTLAIVNTQTATAISNFALSAIATASTFSGAKDLAKENEDAGDAFKKLGMSIQYDSLTGVASNSRPDINQYITAMKKLIDDNDDPGVTLKHLAWVHDQQGTTSHYAVVSEEV